ncbi:MAG TPA: hypothetical protein VGI54_02990 [Solirubrobacteraceae bacterium]
MPFKPSIRTGVALAATVAAGAGAAAIGSAAASPTHQHQAHGAEHAGRAGHRRAGPLRRAVHVDAVVRKRGGGFATATIDRGVVTQVTRSRITLRQGTKKSTWRTHTFSVPGDARVVVDRRRGSLAAAKPGQVAVVAQLPRRTVVRVHDRR